MAEYKGKIQIGSKIYDVEVKNDVRYIDGKTIDAFIETLSEDEMKQMALVGVMALKDEMKGVKPPKGKYQYYSI